MNCRIKNKQMLKIVFAVAMIVLLISVFFLNSKGFIFLLVKQDKDHLTDIARDIIESGEEYPDNSYYFCDIYYNDSINMVEFTTSYWGLVPSGVRKGFYYSPQNIPLGYNYGEISFNQYEEGWLWEEENGDNTIYTEKIVDYWFWFEARY